MSNRRSKFQMEKSFKPSILNFPYDVIAQTMEKLRLVELLRIAMINSTPIFQRNFTNFLYVKSIRLATLSYD